MTQLEKDGNVAPPALFKPWPDEIKALATPETAFVYAMDVKKRQWFLAEPLIATDAYYAYQYARQFIGERWLLGEPAIMTDPQLIYWYAMHVINGRWAEAEKSLRKSRPTYKKYINWLIASVC